MSCVWGGGVSILYLQHVQYLLGDTEGMLAGKQYNFIGTVLFKGISNLLNINKEYCTTAPLGSELVTSILHLKRVSNRLS